MLYQDRSNDRLKKLYDKGNPISLSQINLAQSPLAEDHSTTRDKLFIKEVDNTHHKFNFGGPVTPTGTTAFLKDKSFSTFNDHLNQV